jgi:hypothetical protein
MTEIQRKIREFILGYLDIGYWDLFGACLPVARGIWKLGLPLLGYQY